jgi:serine/threonine-protein kinase
MAADLREQLQATLGDSYTLERELGGGGMSRVFVAHEARLGRRVVVKVLASELTEGMSAERFEREVRLAARLQHPNVVPLLTAGERHGLAYYTMPFVEGESLRVRLAREGRLPVGAAVSVLRDVARALEHAHAHGVVHRDIKPDNILLSGNAAAVADFGIAKALHAARTMGGVEPAGDDGAPTRGVPSEALTRLGTSLGTPAYMAPEQALGDPDVDARADFYSWGVVAYELLAGVTPFAGRTAHRMIAAHISERPAPLGERVASLPPALAALVMRCLEKDPVRRPQSAAELLAALDATRAPSGEQSLATATSARRWVGTTAALALVLIAALAAVTVYRNRRTSAVRPVLAVLPFENVGPAADAYFADGLTEEVRTRLAGISGLIVIGGTSARQYKGSTKSAREIARELGATHLLTGTIRWERAATGDGRVRVNPELVRAADAASIWAEPVDGPLGDVFALQARVAERVAAALDVALRARERRVVAARPTTNVAAYDAYLRGITSITRATVFSAADTRVTIAEFEHAVALDPRFAAAHARLAMAYWDDASLAGDDTTAAAAQAKARSAAERAWALDSTLVETRIARTGYLSESGDQESAYRLARETAQAAPGNVEVLVSLADFEWATGRYDDALGSYERATTLDPRSALAWGQLAGTLGRLRRYEQSIAAHEQEIALVPDNAVAYAVQASTHLLWRADTASARQTIERAGRAPPWIVRFPSGIAGIAIWKHALPPDLTHARDTLTLAGYLAGAGAVAPEMFHLMKLRHRTATGRADRARAHADSIVVRLEPMLERGADLPWMFGWFSRRSVLAEAYATLGRSADAASQADRYMDETRKRLKSQRTTDSESLCHALHNAAYVDVLIGRRDVAVARLAEALGLPCGLRISKALLRADPSWGPLRGLPAFERLVAGTN